MRRLCKIQSCLSIHLCKHLIALRDKTDKKNNTKCIVPSDSIKRGDNGLIILKLKGENKDHAVCSVVCK